MIDMLKGVSVVFIYKIFGALSLLMINMMIGQYYGPEKLGIFSLIVALLMIGSVLSKAGLDFYILKIIPVLDDNLKEISFFIKKIIRIVFFSGLATSILFFVLSDFINEYVFNSFDATYYILGLAFVAIPFAYIGVLPEIFRGFGELNKYSFFRSVSQNLFVLLLLGAGILTSVIFDPVYILYLSIIVTIGLIIIYLHFFLKKKGVNIFASGLYKKPILKYSYPMMLTSTMMLITGYTDSLMISYYMDEYQVGLYTVCLSLSIGIIFIQNSVNIYIAPNISKLYSTKNNLEIRRLYYNSVKLSSFFSVFFFLALNMYPVFFLSLFGEGFSDVKNVLFVVTLSFLINSLCGPVGYTLNMTGNQKINMKVTFFSLALNITANYFLIPVFGILGAAYATFLTMVCKNLIGYYFIHIRVFAVNYG
jgi:O-antigen/teichoic acid export membrane protein